MTSIATAMQDETESTRKTMGRQRLKANLSTPRCMQNIEGKISEQAMMLICNEEAAATIRGQKRCRHVANINYRTCIGLPCSHDLRLALIHDPPLSIHIAAVHPQWQLLYGVAAPSRVPIPNLARGLQNFIQSLLARDIPHGPKHLKEQPAFPHQGIPLCASCSLSFSDPLHRMLPGPFLFLGGHQPCSTGDLTCSSRIDSPHAEAVGVFITA